MAGTGFLSGILRPGAPPSAVRIRHLNHSFGEADTSKQVLFDIELELDPGEFASGIPSTRTPKSPPFIVKILCIPILGCVVALFSQKSSRPA